MTRTPLPILALLLTMGLVSAAAPDDGDGNFTLDSYRKARAVLEASLEAMGGIERIEALEAVEVDWQGTYHRRYQSLRPDLPYGLSPRRELVVLDLVNDRELRETLVDNQGPGGEPTKFRNVRNGEEGIFLYVTWEYFERGDFGLGGGSLHKSIPPLMVLRAYRQSKTARWLGEADCEGATCDVICFPWDENVVVNLYIDTRTKLLVKHDGLGSDVLLGDVTREDVFTDYTKVGGIQLPRKRVVRVGGEVMYDLKARVRVNEDIDESLFEIPAHWNEVSVGVGGAPRLTELGSGAYLAEGLAGWGYNTLFVEFKDHLLAMEAPINSQISAQAISMIRERVPDKPIRYLALSHYHHDHSGGAREYIAAGARIITSPENQEWFERMVVAPHTFTPDALSENPRNPEFELVEGQSRTFTDGQQVVTFYSLGAQGVHVDNMLVAYLPREKMVYVGDFAGGLSRPRTAPAWVGAEVLLEAIERFGLDVERVVDVHGRRGATGVTMDDLASMVQWRRQTRNRAN